MGNQLYRSRTNVFVSLGNLNSVTSSRSDDVSLHRKYSPFNHPDQFDRSAANQEFSLIIVNLLKHRPLTISDKNLKQHKSLFNFQFCIKLYYYFTAEVDSVTF